jgi:hypothetical protein
MAVTAFPETSSIVVVLAPVGNMMLVIAVGRASRDL